MTSQSPNVIELRKLVLSGDLYYPYSPDWTNSSDYISAKVVTYTILGGSVLPSYDADTLPGFDDGNPATGQTPISASMANRIRYSFNLIERFCDLNFIETPYSNTGTETFGSIVIGASQLAVNPESVSGKNYNGFTYSAPNLNFDSDIWLDPDFLTQANQAQVNKGITHEILHALGLDHAFGSGDGPGNFVFNDNLDGRETSDVFTLMTYEDKSLNGHAVWDDDPMLYDIAMLQYLYGARDSDPTNSYSFPTALPDLKTIWDTGPGRDTLNGRDDINANLSLVPGTHSSIVPLGYADASTGDLYNNVAIAFNTIIEDCNGGAMADTIVGNHVGNIINAKGGNDQIFGSKVEYLALYPSDNWLSKYSYIDAHENLADLKDNDTLYGGSGNDLIYGGLGSDVLFGDYGSDTLSVYNDTLYGGAGNDILYGGRGSDVLYGGVGNDHFYEGQYIDLNDSDTIYAGDGDVIGGFTGNNDHLFIDDILITDVVRREIDGRYFDNAGHEWVFNGARTIIDGTIIIGGVLTDGFLGIDVSGKDTPVAAIGPTSFTDTYRGYDPGYDYSVPGDPVYRDGNDTYAGGGGSSDIDGKGGSDTLYGNGGSDVIIGGDGSDLLSGGDGDDRLDGGSTGFSFGSGEDNDTLYGGIGQDNLNSSGVNNFLYGEAGDDVINSNSSGSDVIYGGDGWDRINLYGGGVDNIYGGDGYDAIEINRYEGFAIDLDLHTISYTGFGTGYIDSIEKFTLNSSGAINYNSGTGINDQINIGFTTPSQLLVNMKDGADRIFFNSAFVANITAGSGADYVYAQANQVIVNGNAGFDYIDIGSTSFSGPAARAFGGEGEDQIIGSGSGSLVLHGDGGSDTLSAGISASNTLDGGMGDDSIIAGFGDDVIYWQDGADTINGSAGNDSLIAQLSAGDLASADSMGGVAAWLAAHGVVLNSIEFINGVATDILIGGDDNDILAGSMAAEAVYGGAGDDVLYGGAGDTLVGGEGRDTFIITGSVTIADDDGVGQDILQFGAGITAFTISSVGNNTILHAGGFDVTLVGQLNETLPLVGGFAVDGGAVLDWADVLASGGVDDGMIRGTNAAEEINGTAGDDHIVALGGDDLVNISGGADTLDGGDGIDYLGIQAADAGVVVNLAGRTALYHGVTSTLISIEGVLGSAFADSLRGTTGHDELLGEDGNDTIEGNGGGDSLDGGLGINTISYAHAMAPIYLKLWNNQAVIGADTDTITGFSNVIGSDYADTLEGTSLAETLAGGNGNDLMWGSQSDVIHGDNGNDVLESYNNYSVFYGDAGNDTFNGIYGTSTVYGGDGDDMLIGGASSELLNGGNGNDFLRGGEGGDTIQGAAGNDWIINDIGADSIMGGGDIDMIDYSLRGAGIYVSLIAGINNDNDTISGVERITGTAFADSIEGGTANDTIYGGAGDDTLSGANANDTIYGGDGNDWIADTIGSNRIWGDNGADTISGNAAANNETLYGGAGSDWIFNDASADSINGGTSNDMLDYTGRTSGISVSLLTGVNVDGDTIIGFERVTGTNYADSIDGSNSIDTLYGGNDNDTLAGQGGDDILYGGSGHDSLLGGAGADTLYASSGNDTLNGGDGNDILDGSSGNDTLTGGLGADKFRMLNGSLGSDTVTDFNLADGDRVVLATGASYTTTDLGNDIKITIGANTITLIGVADFSAAMVEYI